MIKKVTTGRTRELLLRALDSMANEQNISLQDLFASDLGCATQVVREIGLDGARIHGAHAQSMFAHVVASLGNDVRECDFGLQLPIDQTKACPDFIVKPANDPPILVQVKNYFKGPLNGPFRLTRQYLDLAVEHSRCLGMPLYFAIYWSKWNIWTLVAAESFDNSDSRLSVSLGTSIKRNEMSLLGDYYIATPPPLSITIHTDANSSRRIESDGSVIAKIRKVCLFANGHEVVDKREAALTFFLLLHGTWDEVVQPPVVLNDDLLHFSMEWTPREVGEPQQFRIIGSMSSMMSSQFRFLTTTEGSIDRITLGLAKQQLGVHVEPNYKGNILKLARFFLSPNLEGTGRDLQKIRSEATKTFAATMSPQIIYGET